MVVVPMSTAAPTSASDNPRSTRTTSRSFQTETVTRQFELDAALWKRRRQAWIDRRSLGPEYLLSPDRTSAIDVGNAARQSVPIRLLDLPAWAQVSSTRYFLAGRPNLNLLATQADLRTICLSARLSSGTVTTTSPSTCA